MTKAIKFYADWCGPCKMFAHTIDNLKSEIGDQARIIKINVDKNQALSGKYQVRGVPTFIIFKDGQLVWRQSGIVKKEELINIINKFS